MEKISASFELISHPDRTLFEHLEACNSISEKQLALKYINANSFFDFALIERMRHLLVYFHDFGKATDYFQVKIIKATEEKKDNSNFKRKLQQYLNWFNSKKYKEADFELEQNDRLSNHAKLGAYFVLSNFTHEDIILSFILLKIIRRHHGNLNNFFVSAAELPQIQLEDYDIEFLEKQMRKTNFELYQNILSRHNLSVNVEHWQGIKKDLSSGRKLSKIQKNFEAKRNASYFFLQHFLFSLLLSADKGDMMLEKDKEGRYDVIKANRRLPLSIVDNYKYLKHSGHVPRDIDLQREEAYQAIAKRCSENNDKAFFSITLPTGLGKTYAAYNVAVQLQNAFADQTGVVPRIVYVLPFTSIIDQNAQILSDILYVKEENQSSWLLKNHYLSPPPETLDDKELDKDEGEYLADGWEHDVIVTTFVQMLESIFTDRNRSLRKFHNMTNAIFILDEVQSIPPQYFEAIELVFKKMNEYFGTKFVFVTATQPFLFENQADICPLADAEKYFKDLKRIVIDQSLLIAHDYKAMNFEEFKAILIDDITTQKDKSFLIICNTIKQSQEIYKTLNENFGEITYLSSSILPIFRKGIVEQIKEAKERQIVVSTQVVEAGVDIDLDIVYRDFAPVDSINQSAGRCNRNGVKGEKGVVKLFNLGKQKYIYDDILLNRTEKILKEYENEILESNLYELNLKYAQEARTGIAERSPQSKAIINAIYELRTEDIEIKLIEADYRHYNVFIPLDNDKECDKIWKKYISACKIEDDFDRKRQIKKIKPQLLQYVTRFPKDKYSTKSDAAIIYATDWKSYYDLKTGFKNTDEKTLII